MSSVRVPGKVVFLGWSEPGRSDPPSYRVPVDARLDRVVVQAMQQTPGASRSASGGGSCDMFS